MTSPEQIAANGRNAALSTGPRTEAGKAASCLNASRHGLLARELLVKGKSKGNLTAFADSIRERLAPDGELEDFVVSRVISAAWRLRRAASVQSAQFNTFAGPNRFDLQHLALERIGLLSRYEVTLERSLYKALESLDQLRRVRQPHDPHSRMAEYAAVSAVPDRKLDRLVHHAEAEIQENPEEIGFVSQKCINPADPSEGA
jgi:hypothetical protein